MGAAGGISRGDYVEKWLSRGGHPKISKEKGGVT